MLRFVTLSTDARFVFLTESMAASRFTVRALALKKPQALPLPLLSYAEKVTGSPGCCQAHFPGGQTEHPHLLAGCFFGSPATSQDGVHVLPVLIYKQVSVSRLRRCMDRMANLRHSLCKCPGLPQMPHSWTFNIWSSAPCVGTGQETKCWQSMGTTALNSVKDIDVKAVCWASFQ